MNLLFVTKHLNHLWTDDEYKVLCCFHFLVALLSMSVAIEEGSRLIERERECWSVFEVKRFKIARSSTMRCCLLILCKSVSFHQLLLLVKLSKVASKHLWLL